MTQERMKELLEYIDVDWVEENPFTAYTLIESLIKELYHYKDVVQMQRESILLAKALLSEKTQK